MWHVAKIPGELVAYGRYGQRMGDIGNALRRRGENHPVAVSQLWDTDVRNFHVSGKIEASSEPQDMRLQRMLGHLPALVHPAAFGAGRRLRRGRDGRHVHDASERYEDHDLRNRTARAEDCREVLQGGKISAW